MPVIEPISMIMDNQAAIKMLESEGSMTSVKYVDVRMKFIFDCAKKGIVKPKFVESKLMGAGPVDEDTAGAMSGGAT